MSSTVLYVEDNDDNVQLVRQVLRLRPHVTLEVATTGASGVTMAAQLLPALILLDRRLPDIRGEQVLRQLREVPATATIPVVVFSGDAGYGTHLADFPGVDGFLGKPFDLADLLATVDRFVRPPVG